MDSGKVNYGIDLGTTNSSIARMQYGKVNIIKSDRFQKLITPSCVYFSDSKKIFVGDNAYNRLAMSPENVFRRFKYFMGTYKKFYSSNMDREYTPEELSAEVLKALKSYVKDDNVETAVITVPAAFKQREIAATQTAAELAGFRYCELLQEPIAASLAYGINEKEIGGYWLVFDLGGGTFDAALMASEDGIIKVVDTEGDNRLGGEDMDEAIANKIILSYIKDNYLINNILEDERKNRILYQKLKLLSEQVKIGLSDMEMFNIGEDVMDPNLLDLGMDENGKVIDITGLDVTREQVEKVIKSIVDRSIEKTRSVISRNHLKSEDLKTVLLVGGPTYMPYLRQRLKEEVNPNINVSINPMTAVAEGAAIFASTRKLPKSFYIKSPDKVNILLSYPDTTIEEMVKMGIKYDDDTKGEHYLEIFRTDQKWSSGKILLEKEGIILDLPLFERDINYFKIRLFDKEGNQVECAPETFSIMRGLKIANPPLPHDIGISSIVLNDEEEREIMIPILEKGQTLPAIGKQIFKTRKNIRPGNSSDKVKIVIWEGRRNTLPIYNDFVYELVISGDMISDFLPEGSDLEITLKLDESRRIEVIVYIPYIDETITGDFIYEPKKSKKPIPGDEIEEIFKEEEQRLEHLKAELENLGDSGLQSNIKNIEQEFNKLREEKERQIVDSDGMNLKLKERLSELQIEIDKINSEVKWPRLENEFREDLNILEEVVEKWGYERDGEILEELKQHGELSIQQRNEKMLKDVIEKINILRFNILSRKPEFWVSIFMNIKEDFNSINWKNYLRAKELIEEGQELIIQGTYSDSMRTIIRQLWDLMPDYDRISTQRVRPDLPFFEN